MVVSEVIEPTVVGLLVTKPTGVRTVIVEPVVVVIWAPTVAGTVVVVPPVVGTIVRVPTVTALLLIVSLLVKTTRSLHAKEIGSRFKHPHLLHVNECLRNVDLGFHIQDSAKQLDAFQCRQCIGHGFRILELDKGVICS